MEFKQFIKEGIIDDIFNDIGYITPSKEVDSDVKTDKDKLISPKEYKFKYDIEDLKKYSHVKGIESDINKSLVYAEIIEKPDYYRKNKGKQINLVFMSPKEYLEQTAKGFNISYNENLKNIDKNLAREYAEKMIEGNIFPTPHIDYTGRIFLQEGRHRAYAAMLLNKKEIPVLIVSKV